MSGGGEGRPAFKPIWDRGEPIDLEMLAYTIGDDWLQDRRLVEVDIRGSEAHADGLLRAGLLQEADHAAIRRGLGELLASFQRGEWTVEEGEEDVHSAVERRLVELVGEPGKRLHTGRSRNDQVAVDMRLWLRGAIEEVDALLTGLGSACAEHAKEHGDLPLPGYTHLRRGMPSSVADWIGAYAVAFADDRADLDAARRRISRCPLGTGAGYGVPLALDRAGVAEALGFESVEEPVTLTQLSRGRAELAYVSALENVAVDLGKLAADLWLYTTDEFGFMKLPVELSTGSSLMPHKRNPDLIELIRANCRQLLSERAALIDVVRDLPSGYHRDFQLIKPALFRAHDRGVGTVRMMSKLVSALTWDEGALMKAADDPSLQVTARALERAASGEAFRDAYRDESRRSTH